MMDFLKKMLGVGNDAQLKKLKAPVAAVMALEQKYRGLTDAQLRAKTDEFRARLQKGETEDDILPEAFATVREAADRVLGMRPYEVQVLGGIVLRLPPARRSPSRRDRPHRPRSVSCIPMWGRWQRRCWQRLRLSGLGHP